MIGVVLSAYFYGYMVTQVLGGTLSERWSAKWTLFLSIFISSSMTIVSPIAARINVWLFFAVRVLIGLSHGVTNSSCYSLLSVWIPKQERASAIVRVVIVSSQLPMSLLVDNDVWRKHWNDHGNACSRLDE